ncbi:glycerophosphoryl diester phosphodiesterase [Pedobacter sp. UYP30]|uniref:glycerophosphodiester phosphodiesterase n=1 Tax=Pedobacter sp. UYP30 TaxID=1756400 RepID=UPI00339689D9
MRIIFIGLVAIILTSCKIVQNKTNFHKNVVVAHRGAWKTLGLPQNSIASLKQAIKLGYRGSEFDVRMTSDDSLVIHHDPDFNNLEIEKTTFAELRKFKLSNGEELPTLHEYLSAGLANNSGTMLVCEIKPYDGGAERADKVATKVVQTVKDLNAQKLVGYISFDYNILKKVHQLDPKATTQYLEANKTPEEVAADGLTGVDYYFTAFQKNKDWISMAKKKGITLNAWTVNNPEDMDWLLKDGFDFITTNEPELLLSKEKALKK